MNNYVNYKNEREFACNFGHIFTSKLETVEMSNVTRKELCRVCKNTSRWNRLIDKLNRIGITNIISTMNEFAEVSNAKVRIACSNNHQVFKTKRELMSNARENDDGLYKCTECT